MTSFPILDLIAGMIFIYFLLAIINNSCIELYAALIQLRSVMLKKWIENTFGAEAKKLFFSGYTPYLHSKVFAQKVGEQVYASSFEPISIVELVNKSSVPEHTKKVLHCFALKTAIQKRIDGAINGIEHFEAQIEQWFDLQMECVTTAYKRKAMWFTFAFATIITVALNIDSLQLASYLYKNPQVRNEWAIASSKATSDSAYLKQAMPQQTESDSGDPNKILAEINKNATGITLALVTMHSGLPIGWPDHDYVFATKTKSSFWFYLKKTGGLIITILAVCLGAPFWFDVLSRVANLRTGVKPKV